MEAAAPFLLPMAAGYGMGVIWPERYATRPPDKLFRSLRISGRATFFNAAALRFQHVMAAYRIWEAEQSQRG